jgi:hypothetical protein
VSEPRRAAHRLPPPAASPSLTTTAAQRARMMEELSRLYERAAMLEWRLDAESEVRAPASGGGRAAAAPTSPPAALRPSPLPVPPWRPPSTAWRRTPAGAPLPGARGTAVSPVDAALQLLEAAIARTIPLSRRKAAAAAAAASAAAAAHAPRSPPARGAAVAPATATAPRGVAVAPATATAPPSPAAVTGSLLPPAAAEGAPAPLLLSPRARRPADAPPSTAGVRPPSPRTPAAATQAALYRGSAGAPAPFLPSAATGTPAFEALLEWRHSWGGEGGEHGEEAAAGRAGARAGGGGGGGEAGAGSPSKRAIIANLAARLLMEA